MKKFTKKDFIYALVTGVTTGLLAWGVLVFLGVQGILGVHPMLLVVFIPIAWIVGVWFGYFLGQRIGFFTQFGRFVAIGFTNASVDFGVLYLLIGLTNHFDGTWYSLFKAVSFTVAVIHSYFWNKYWTFDAGASSGGRSEFVKFVAVAVLSAIVNVAVASFVVSVKSTGPLAGVSPAAWAGIGAVVGSAAALIFSFIGFRVLVFKKAQN